MTKFILFMNLDMADRKSSLAFDKLSELEKYRDRDDRMTTASAFFRENDTGSRSRTTF